MAPSLFRSSTRRIVSRSEYSEYLGLKLTAGAYGLTLLSIGAVGLISVALYSHWMMNFENERALMLSVVFGQSFGAFASLCFVICGCCLLRDTVQMERVEPISRSNIVRVPQEETLLRSSVQPATESAMSLLRPISVPSRSDEQELLRPL